jgi:hypothetical protein
MAQGTKSTVGDPIWVESILTDAEYKSVQENTQAHMIKDL